MTKGSELKSPAAKALREAGFVPLPRLWVTPDQMEVIVKMAEGNRDVVNDIRGKANRVAKCAEQVRLGRPDLDLAEMGFTFGCIAEARRIVEKEKK